MEEVSSLPPLMQWSLGLFQKAKQNMFLNSEGEDILQVIMMHDFQLNMRGEKGEILLKSF